MLVILLVELPAEFRGRAGRGVDLGAVHLHQCQSVNLPVVNRSNPEDGAFDSRKRRRVRKRSAPLASASLGCYSLKAFLLGIIHLRQCCVDLMAASWAVELGLVVDPGWCIEVLFQIDGPEKLPRPTRLPIELQHLRWNIYPALLRHLLLEAFVDQELRQLLKPRRALVRVLRRRHRLRQVGDDVIPSRRHVLWSKRKLNSALRHLFLQLRYVEPKTKNPQKVQGALYQ